MYWEMVMQPVSVEKNPSGLIYSGVAEEVHGGRTFMHSVILFKSNKLNSVLTSSGFKITMCADSLHHKDG